MIEGYKVINEIRVQPNEFVKAIRNKLKESIKTGCDNYSRDYIPSLKHTILSIYDNFLKREKRILITKQKKQFIKNLNVAEGDILELNNKQIVCLSSFSFSKDFELEVGYSIIKEKLELSQRSGKIVASKVEYYLKAKDFFQYKNQNVILGKSRFKNWMEKRKVKFDYTPFEPDLISCTD